jgi:hypothetical protein
MNDRAFDPNAWFDAYRDALGPVNKAQQEGLKAFERFAQLNYAVAGDCLNSGLAHVQAAVDAKSPADLIGRGAELSARLGETLRGRIQEFVSMTNDAQSAFVQFAGENAARAASHTQAQTRAASHRHKST